MTKEELMKAAKKTIANTKFHTALSFNGAKVGHIRTVGNITNVHYENMQDQVSERDKRKLAKIPPDGPRVSGFEKWAKNPSQWDWPGIDTPDESTAEPISHMQGGLKMRPVWPKPEAEPPTESKPRKSKWEIDPTDLSPPEAF